MDFGMLARRVGLTPNQIDAAEQAITDLHAEFSELCAKPWPERADSPLTALAKFIVETYADSDAATKRMLQLLSEPVGDGTRLNEIAACENRVRHKLEALLDQKQLSIWRNTAPALLEIDVGERPFEKLLAKEVGRLRRPVGFLCTSPFEYAHLQANGDVYPCCPSKFGKIIGNLRTQSLAEIWRSEAANDVRESMIDGSYRFCNADACEYLRDARATGKNLSPPALTDWAQRQNLLTLRPAPRVVNFAFDKSCNLSCSYCRREAFRPSENDLRILREIDRNIFDSSLEGAERIILLGEGDPFASPFYRDRLQNYDWSQYPKLRIKIQTNGLLLTPEMWASIAMSHQAIDWISVSVDAATPATYRLNRKGDFALLLANLEFIAELYRQKNIRHFHINFLVQANNFREVPGFAELGKRLGCDLIEFQRLENWGTYTDEEYRERAIHEIWHPQHDEFVHVLHDPALDHPTVWLLKLGDCVRETKAVSVISYDNCI
jgi:radical SAM protein with 4Fe4S-binding SPASM domain